MWTCFAKIAEAFRNSRPYQLSRRMREWRRSPGVNVDGTPMIGRVDIHGRGYGSTKSYRSRHRYRS